MKGASFSIAAPSDGLLYIVIELILQEEHPVLTSGYYACQRCTRNERINTLPPAMKRARFINYPIMLRSLPVFFQPMHAAVDHLAVSLTECHELPMSS